MEVVLPSIAVVVSTQNCPNQEVLSSCLDTLLAQTYKTLRICVLVDEQNSALIHTVGEYLTRDERIKLVTTHQHTIVSDFYMSRTICSEPYIAFVEATEWFDEKYIASLYEQLIDTNSQIAVSGFTWFNEEKSVYHFFNLEFVSDTRSAQFLVEHTPALMWYEQFRQKSLTGKLYRRDILQKAFLLGECIAPQLLAIQVYLVCENITFTSGAQYVKRRIDGNELTIDEENVSHYLQGFNQLFQYLSYKQYQTHHYFKEYKEVLHRLLAVCNAQQEEQIEQELNVLSVLMTL